MFIEHHSWEFGVILGVDRMCAPGGDRGLGYFVCGASEKL